MKTKMETEVSDTIKKMNRVKHLSESLEAIDKIISLARDPNARVAVHTTEAFAMLGFTPSVFFTQSIIQFYEPERRAVMKEIEQLMK